MMIVSQYNSQALASCAVYSTACDEASENEKVRIKEGMREINLRRAEWQLSHHSSTGRSPTKVKTSHD